MKVKILLSLLSLVLMVACQTEVKTEESKANDNSKAPANAETTKDAKPANTGPVKFPVEGVVMADTKAKAGEHVLVPSYNWLQDAQEKGLDKVTMIFYAQKMDTPGKDSSKVKFMSDSQDVPNVYIIPIPAGQSAKKGDIVLTWWQSGSGMNRAIVTDDADPKRPVVRYLDIEYDNPAQSSDKKTTIGKMDEQLKPDTFVLLNSPMQSGTAVSISEGGEIQHGQLINVVGDKVYVQQFAGKTAVYDRAKVSAVPIKPTVQAGDTVKAERFGKFATGKVTKVDAAIGRVFVKFDNGGDKEEAVAFGDVMK